MKTTEDILNSLEAMEQAAPHPFLATRVKAKLQQPQGAWDRVITIIAKPAFAFATILFILALNVIVFVKSNNFNSTTKSNNEEELIATNYETGASAIYNIENNTEDEK